MMRTTVSVVALFGAVLSAASLICPQTGIMLKTFISGVLTWAIRKLVIKKRKQILIGMIKNMSLREFSGLYPGRLFTSIRHRMYDHAQVLMQLAKFIDHEKEGFTGVNTYEKIMLRILQNSDKNVAMMDVILVFTFLSLESNKFEEVPDKQALDSFEERVRQTLQDNHMYTSHHVEAISLYTELLSNTHNLNKVVSVHDSGKDWHLDDILALFVWFNVLKLSNPAMKLHIIGAGYDPSMATENHKVIAYGILGEKLCRDHMIFTDARGAANQETCGVQHVVKFVRKAEHGLLTCNPPINDADIVAVCAETSFFQSIKCHNIKAKVAGLQGGFDRKSDGTFIGFNPSQSHDTTELLLKWMNGPMVESQVCATGALAQNLSDQGTAFFNQIFCKSGVSQVDMNLRQLIERDCERYSGIEHLVPGVIEGECLYDTVTPYLVQLGMLHNPRVFVMSIPGIKDLMCQPRMINIHAIQGSNTTWRKVTLLVRILCLKAAFCL